MHKRSHFLLSVISTLLSLSLSIPDAQAGAYDRSIQNVLTGASSVTATTNYGRGMVFGIIDSGVISGWTGFSSSVNGMGLNSINTSSSAVCLYSSSCSTSYPSDTNGHGTFVASELVGGIPNAGITSIAPKATAISVQVVDGSGNGTAADAANGIVYAVNRGAKVVNVSLGPGAGTSGAQFYKEFASAVNYAASKNVVVVFAGGNSGQDFVSGATVTGFTDAALKRMLFMGSTNSNKQLSSFSNRPGVGYFLSTSGKKYYYENMWLLADGENVWGASTKSGANGYTYIKSMSGTSMAAPQGTGAIGLLAVEWPILLTRGTATDLLEKTADHMGGTSVNRTYGWGFINLVRAFQPYGTLTVKTTSGSSVAVSSLTYSMMSKGALGSLSTIRTKLSNWTAFDSYTRNFYVNLSGIVAKTSTGSTAAKTAHAPIITSTGTRFTDGSSMTFASSETPAYAVSQSENEKNKNWAMSYTDATGSTFAAGSGFPASASFSDVMWGNGSAFSAEAATVGASNALTDLASGGTFAAYGTNVGDNTRLAFGWTESQPINAAQEMTWTTPESGAFTAGVATDVTDSWKAGMTVGVLNEQHGLLGTTYDDKNLLGFGPQHQSVSVGFSSAFDLGGDRSLMFDGAISRTNGSAGTGLVSSVSPMLAASYGAAFVQENVNKKGDKLSVSLRSPLRVFSGSAKLMTATVDESGEPVYRNERVGLAPSGHELDLAIGYERPMTDKATMNLSLEGRNEPDNVAGKADIAIMIGGRMSF